LFQPLPVWLLMQSSKMNITVPIAVTNVIELTIETQKEDRKGIGGVQFESKIFSLFSIFNRKLHGIKGRMEYSGEYMRLTPITRRELIKRLRNLGWDGPLSGGIHQFMVKGAMKLPIPNPHGGVLSVGMVSEILKETGISHEEWLSAN
jgi:predicted RNA binding protein YcfA (HicA-like mRNA interferase family)